MNILLIMWLTSWKAKARSNCWIVSYQGSM